MNGGLKTLILAFVANSALSPVKLPFFAYFIALLSYHTIGMSVPLMNFCRWYSVISRFLTRPRVAHLLLLLAPPRWFPTTTAPPWTAWTPPWTPPPLGMILKLFFIIVLLLPPLLCVEVGLCVKYGHISEAEAIAMAVSPLLSLLSLSTLVSKPFLAAGVSVVNGGTGGCFLWIVAYNWCSMRFWRFSIVQDLGISP